MQVSTFSFESSNKEKKVDGKDVMAREVVAISCYIERLLLLLHIVLRDAIALT